MNTIHTPDPTRYPIPRASKPMPIGKRVALAAVGTLGVVAALGLGATIEAVAAPSSVPSSTATAAGLCRGPHGRIIACPGGGGEPSFPSGGTYGEPTNPDGGVCIPDLVRGGCLKPT
jgi:uncharacterized membrane protein